MFLKWARPNESSTTVALELKRACIAEPLVYNAINSSDQGKLRSRRLELLERLLRLRSVNLNLFARLNFTYFPYLLFREFLMMTSHVPIQLSNLHALESELLICSFDINKGSCKLLSVFLAIRHQIALVSLIKHVTRGQNVNITIR